MPFIPCTALPIPPDGNVMILSAASQVFSYALKAQISRPAAYFRLDFGTRPTASWTARSTSPARRLAVYAP